MKVKLQIIPDGTVRVVTVENAGTACRGVVDSLTGVLGKPDETSRADTPDLFIETDREQDVDA
jgi:hypothetical protein